MDAAALTDVGERLDTFIDEVFSSLGRSALRRSETASAITARRRRNAIPDQERYRTKSAMTLEMLDELASWGRVPPVIVADAGYGDSAAFRQGLTDRDLVYVVAAKGATLAHRGDALAVRGTADTPGEPHHPP